MTDIFDYSTEFTISGSRFGSAPRNKEQFDLLHSLDYFLVDLKEIRSEYSDLHYPIKDRKAPANDVKFKLFIKQLLNQSKKLYIFCQGGHGRSGLVVAIYLIHHLNITGEEALDTVHKYHQTRKTMSVKMRRLGSPQTKVQKDFVLQYLKA